MNAISLLKQDHRNVESLFKRFEAAGDDALEKRTVVDQVIEQLSIHAEIEEQVLYPAMRQRFDDDDPVLEALEEHHLAKVSLWELEKLPASSDRFDAKFTVLAENIRHHVEEEEAELFEQLRKAFKANELDEMGDRMEQLKKVVPTRPHPLSPDQPPLNALLGLPVAVLDRVVTTGKGLVTKALHRRAA
jgi:hemerythrin-like domain-containing protein